MPRLAVTAIGADRPGIITRITGVLRDAEANVADSTTTILGGHCTMMLLVDAPEAVEPHALQEDLAAAVADLEVVVTVHALGPGSPSMPATHVLTVYSPDRVGIVHDVTSVVADRGINVTDGVTRLLDGEQPVHTAQLEISAGEPGTAEELVSELRSRLPEAEVHAEPLEVVTF